MSCRTRSFLITLAVMCVGYTAVLQAQTVETGFLNRALVFDGVQHRYQVYVPREFQRTKLWPVILVLHGGGDYGSDGLHQTTIGMAQAIREHADHFPAIVVFAQCPDDGTAGWQGKGGEVALAELDEAVSEFHGDHSRVYLTGYSAGGNGAWSLLVRHPDRFAALIVVSGFITEHHGTSSGIFYPSLAAKMETNPYRAVARLVPTIPIWMFHGDADQIVPVEESRQMFASLKSLGHDAHYTEILGAGHFDAIHAAYNHADLMKWLLKQTRQ